MNIADEEDAILTANWCVNNHPHLEDLEEIAAVARNVFSEVKVSAYVASVTLDCAVIDDGDVQHVRNANGVTFYIPDAKSDFIFVVYMKGDTEGRNALLNAVTRKANCSLQKVQFA